MAGTADVVHVSRSDGLFDKYLLPKVALAVILAASLVGTAVTGRLSGGLTAGTVLLKWGYFVSLGVVTGGLLWKHGFVRPRDLDADARPYCRAMADRFDRLAVGSLAVLLPAGAVVLAHAAAVLGVGPLVGGLAVALGALAIAVAVSAVRRRPVEAQFRSRLGLVGLGAALLAVALTAVTEVHLEGGGAVSTGVRVLHLLAFSLWIGGAVWNIFVAVPSGKARPTTGVVRAAAEQLERFRWSVRVIIPTLLLTGLVQAGFALGTRPGPYLGTAIGLAVLGKLGLVGVLVVIFKTCPMWRACSPIDGVCDLEDLADGRVGSTDRQGGVDA